MTSSIGHEILSTQIAARKELLRHYVRFIEDMIRTLGTHRTEVGRTDRSSKTRVVRELREFGSFSFRTVHSISLLHDYEVSAWWHPARNGVTDYGAKNLVFEMFYEPCPFDPNDPDCRVETFLNDGTWRAALDVTIARKDEIIAEKKGTTDELRRHAQQGYEHMRAEAIRLGIVA
jgi:hypothetical protein